MGEIIQIDSHNNTRSNELLLFVPADLFKLVMSL